MAKTKLADNLARLMKERGFNQVELAKRSGVPQSLISRYLRSDAKAEMPSVENLIALAKALRVTLDELTGITAAQIEKAESDVETGNLTDDERLLLEAWKKLPPDHWLRKAIADVLPREKDDKNETG